MNKEVKDAIKVLEQATANCAVGDRHLVVLDRGWIFVGDVSLDKDTNIYTITNCKNVRKWSTGGFGGLTKSSKISGAVLDDSVPIKFHARAMIFCTPVGKDWDND